MAKIEKLKKGTATIYPATIPQAVVDPATEKTVREELDERANHGYESNPKSLKEVDDEKAEHGYAVEETPKTLKEVDDEVSQLAGEVSLLDAVQGAKIKDIENVLSSANLGQSAKISASGRKVVSLPKNASNGGAEVKLEGLTAENLVVNGDFRNGTTGWANAGSSTMSVENNELTTILTLATGYNRIERALLIVSGNKYYARGEINPKYDTLTYFNVGGANSSLFPVVPGRWNALSAIVTAQTNSQYRLYHSAETKYAVGDAIKYRNMLSVDLTATFGSGNEPDLATCDKIFSDYFEGVKSFVPTGRVRSVGKNLFDGKWVMGAVSLSGDFIPSSTEIRSVTPIKVSSLKNYIGLNTTNTPVYVYYSSETVFNSTTLLLRTTAQAHTSPAGAKTCFLKIISTNLNYNFQYGVGTITSPYEPYKETNLYLTAPELRSNGTVKDEIRKGANGYELVKRISDVDGSVLTTPEITPISYGGVLNSASNGTVYHEPIIADAGVYETNLPILMQDYPIATIEEIIKHENGIDTYLNVATAVIASDGLSFTHPDLADGDLVLFTYAFDKERTNGNITATFYDSNVVKIDTVTGKAYRINEVVTNGVLTRTLTEV